MDIKEKIKKARIKTEEKYSAYMKAEMKLSEQADGFFEKRYWDNLVKAKIEWQIASNDFHGLLSYLNNNS